ncbi:unnamed protein product [Rhodiola kirilowii]
MAKSKNQATRCPDKAEIQSRRTMKLRSPSVRRPPTRQPDEAEITELELTTLFKSVMNSLPSMKGSMTRRSWTN